MFSYVFPARTKARKRTVDDCCNVKQHLAQFVFCAVIFIFSRQMFRDIQQYFGFRMGNRQNALQWDVSQLTELIYCHLNFVVLCNIVKNCQTYLLSHFIILIVWDV